MSKCHCDYCQDGRDKRYDLNSIEDYDDEPRYRKTRKRNRKVCAKSKTGEPCLYTVPVVQWAYYSKSSELWHSTRVITCERCGRHGRYTFDRSYRKPLQ